jgi:nicotinate-nucleotide--dimethylbenzimidazole phosphoribosyltransferase
MTLQHLTLKEIISGINPLDASWIEKARARTETLVMPTRALGRMHLIAEKLCGLQKTLSPRLNRKAVIIMAGDHGVAAVGVSAYPQEVTGAMIHTFLSGGAGVNAFCRHTNTESWVVDMGIIPNLDPSSLPNSDQFLIFKHGSGTSDFTHGPAMDRNTAESTILTGFKQAAARFAAGVDILVTGDMGIGNTTPSAAIGTVMTGMDPETMTGPGTGVQAEALMRKVEVIKKGISVNRPDPTDALDVLSKIGGFEIGGIAGLILAGAYYQKPVVVDGFISTAGALIAGQLNPLVTQYLFAGHKSEEPGHQSMLKHLGLDPILDLGMRLGEGSGGVLALSIIEAAARMMREVMTFDQAGVANKD